MSKDMKNLASNNLLEESTKQFSMNVACQIWIINLTVKMELILNYGKNFLIYITKQLKKSLNLEILYWDTLVAKAKITAQSFAKIKGAEKCVFDHLGINYVHEQLKSYFIP